jgi:hypothetical protein
MTLKSLIMPGIIFFSLLLILPPAGVSGLAVLGIAFVLALWSWLSGRITRSVANFGLDNGLSCLGLLLMLGTAVLTSFFGSLVILHKLADFFPTDITIDSGAILIAAFIFVLSNAVRIILNALTEACRSYE